MMALASWLVLVLILQISSWVHSLEPQCEKNGCESSEGHLKAFGSHRPADSPVSVLKYSPSGSEFYHRYIYGRKPVVIRGAANHWPAMKLWKNETYLREKAGSEAFIVDYRKHFKNEQSVRIPQTVSAFLDIYKTQDVYLDSPFPPSKLIHDVMLPCILNCDEISSTMSQMTLLMSNGNTTSAFHQDGYDNIITMVSGTKRVILVDSIHAERLYADTEKIFPGILSFDPNKIDFKKFPQLADVPFSEVTLHEGDMIYIPQYWWHIVYSTGSPNIAATHWFGMFDFEKEFEEMGISEDTDIVKITLAYEELVKKQPSSIKCDLSNKALNTILKINTSDPAMGHLRIPKQNERPADLLLASGYTMPVMGFGTGLLGNATSSAVKIALDTGYRMIDTAQGYPLSEPQVAEAIARSGVPRSELFLIDKLHPRFLGYGPTIKAIEMSLRTLDTDYIDLFLIHSKHCDSLYLTCGEGEPSGTWQESWKAMEAMQKKGKIRSLGVSNFNLEEMKELVEFATVPVSALENWFDPFHQDRKVRKFCLENDIHYIGYSTLGTRWVQLYGLKTNPVLQSKVFAEISSHYEYVVSQVVLRWAIHQNVTVIPRSRNTRNIYHNFRTLDFSLNDNEIETITNITDYEYHPLERIDRGEGACNDLSDNCKERAEAGDCKTNTDWMLNNCKKSCQLCVVEDPSTYEPLVYVGSEDSHVYAIGVLYGQLRWTFAAEDKILSRPAVSVDGQTSVFFGSNDGKVYAVSATSGKLLWSYQTSGAIVASPVVTANGNVFVGSHDHSLYSFDAANGTLNWRKDMKGTFYASVAVDETRGVLFAGSAAEEGPRVFALSIDTGDIEWEFAAAGKIYASPALSVDRKVVYFCSLDHNIYALETQTGNQVWSFDTGSEIESSPAVSREDGTLYVGLVGGKLLAVNTLPGPLMGTVKSTMRAGDEVVSSPLLTEDGRLFVGVGDGRILAVNRTTSDILWSPTTGGYVSSSVAVGRDNVVYASSTDHHVYALNGEDGSIIWKYKTNGSISLSSPTLPQHYRMNLG